MSVSGFGVHTAMWAMDWNREAAEYAIPEAVRHGIDFLEITMLDPEGVDTDHTKRLLEKHDVECVCSLGMPLDRLPTNDPEGALAFLKLALDRSHAIGARAMSGVIYGGIGQRTGFPPTVAEIDATARVVRDAAAYAASLGMEYGLEAVNRYENHILNTAEQAVAMVEKVGADNVFIHLDTYHMNIEEDSFSEAIETVGDKMGLLHIGENNRKPPGQGGHLPWDEIFGAVKEIGYDGKIVMEPFVRPGGDIAQDIALWRDLAEGVDLDEEAKRALEFTRNQLS